MVFYMLFFGHKYFLSLIITSQRDTQTPSLLLPAVHGLQVWQKVFASGKPSGAVGLCRWCTFTWCDDNPAAGCLHYGVKWTATPLHPWEGPSAHGLVKLARSKGRLLKRSVHCCMRAKEAVGISLMRV